ncbi:MAG: sensor domain-containing diguanylate cyclase [Paraglaciecola sp.]|nr:sensor domain-containing diguanylate cyclase [Paraglaciecola sp.]
MSAVSDEFFINEHLDFLQSNDENLTFEQVFQQYQLSSFSHKQNSKVSFGFTSDVVWASVSITNSSADSIKKVFYIDSAWLDRGDFYFIRHNALVKQNSIGDTLPFAERPNRTRMMTQQYVFEPGTTDVIMRFKSNDPLLIPIYLTDESLVQNNVALSSYFYGFLYGAFFILLIYNIALSVGLKDVRYVFYSLYLLSFLSLNIAYTGHGFKYIWPDNLYVQSWAMIIFLYFYIIFAIAFCFEFLKLKVFTPRLYKLKIWIYAALIIIGGSLFITGKQLLAVHIGVILTSLLVVVFISLGFVTFKSNHRVVQFFIPAVLMGAGGAAISAATTWGIISYNAMLFHSIEIGMLIEMFIFALALAFDLKEVNKARLIAEVDAQFDHLTALYNRRAFSSVANNQWHLNLRLHKNMSMILLDIDWFKKINDDHGHAAGDAVLKKVASILKNKVRKSDVLARWGGEEFIIFLPNTNKVAATGLANTLREDIQALRVIHDGQSLTVTASFGVAGYVNQLSRLEELIKLADVALYQAKDSGRNTVFELPDEPDNSPQCITPH